MTGDIVLATRFGAASAAPAAVAGDLAQRFDARVTLVYVASELDALELASGEAGVDAHEERERVLVRIRTEMSQFVALHLPDREVAVQVLQGSDVAELVTRTARERAAAFLVVGTRGRSQIARLILGDTTQSILQRAPCPVVVVPLHDEPDESA